MLPDTQYYSEQNYDFSDHFYDQTRWVMENKDAYEIVADYQFRDRDTPPAVGARAACASGSSRRRTTS